MDDRSEATPCCETEAARLLPWFVTGRLEPDDSARVEAHLADCPTCRSELGLQRMLRDALRADDRVELSPHPSLDQLLHRIDELDREIPAAASEGATAATTATRAGPPSRWLVAALLLQTVGLVLLCSLLWGRPAGPLGSARYQTLTASTVVGPVPAQIRVVFAPGTSVAEVARILRRTDARIVDGPSEAGAYALALADGAASPVAIGDCIARLREDTSIVFAEPIVGGSPNSR